MSARVIDLLKLQNEKKKSTDIHHGFFHLSSLFDGKLDS